MTTDEYLQRHCSLCERIFERMCRENSFPWMEDPEGWEEFMKELE